MGGTGPQVGKRLFRVLPTPVPFSKSQNSEAGRDVPTKRSEQMLSAHSRKLGAQRPAAHSLSHRGPPLALTPALWPGLGGWDRKYPTADARTEDKPEASNCDYVSALSGVLLLFRGQRRFHRLLGTFGQAAVPVRAFTRPLWPVAHSGAFWI